MLEKYGGENISQSEAVIERRRQTNLARYGATSYAGSQEGKARIEATMLERYGAKNFMQSDAAKARRTQQEQFGADHYTRSAEYSRNHTFNASGIIIRGLLNIVETIRLMRQGVKIFCMSV